MPRIVFDNAEELKRFCQEVITPKRHNYVIFRTSDNELIIHQIVSTRPVFVIYYRADSREVLETLIRDLQNTLKLRVYDVKAVEWDSEKPVGMRIPLELVT